MNKGPAEHATGRAGIQKIAVVQRPWPVRGQRVGTRRTGGGWLQLRTTEGSSTVVDCNPVATLAAVRSGNRTLGTETTRNIPCPPTSIPLKIFTLNNFDKKATKMGFGPEILGLPKNYVALMSGLQ